MSEVIKRDKRALLIAQLYETIKNEKQSATLAMVTVWQNQLKAHWETFEDLHDSVLDRAGSSEMPEQHEVYDETYKIQFKCNMAIEKLRMQLNTPSTNVADQVPAQLELRHAALCARLKTLCRNIIDVGAAIEPVQVDVQRHALQQLYASFQDVGLQRIAHGSEQGAILGLENEANALYLNAAGVLATAQMAAAQMRDVQRQPDDAAPNNNNHIRDAEMLKMPQLNITSFDGKFEKWEAFRESFHHSIHLRTTINAVQKLQYLKYVVRGEPEELIRNFALTAENYESAWKIHGLRTATVVESRRVFVSLLHCGTRAPHTALVLL